MRLLGIVMLFGLIAACSPTQGEKVNGISFVASREALDQVHIDSLALVHPNFVAIMPFGFLRDPNSPEIIFDSDRQWYGETGEGARQYILLLHKNGIKVMLKPQLWIWRGEFTGNLEMGSDAHWQELEAAYSKFILRFARLASETGTDIFCIGTELGKFVSRRPAYWNDLIAKVRGLYTGKLTYAANWDEYGKVPFWPQLDYVGIDAYFPLSQEKTPSVAGLRRAWQPWKAEMAHASDSLKRPILFTEYGYRSMDFTAWKPWEVERKGTGVNLQGQRNAQQALFEELWSEDWFAGGFLWKWFIDHAEVGGTGDNRFTPQNKPAEAVVREWYGRYPHSTD